MIERTPIRRVPIRLRKAIHKEFCKCYNTKVMSVNGVPHLLMADSMTLSDIENFLSDVQVSTPVYFSSADMLDKARLFLDKGIPVTVKTSRVLTNYELEMLRKVPHCAVHLSMKFLDGFIRSRLDSSSPDPSAFREMAFLAKSWKIFLALDVEYYPHLMKKLDLFEIVEMYKNLVSHVLLRFPTFTDEELRGTHITQWEALSLKYIEDFKHYYMPIVPERSWEVKPRYQQEFISELSDFIKVKRLGLEVVEWDDDDRVRHQSTGLSDLALGIKPFMYVREGDTFVKAPVSEEEPCGKCGKTIFF